jgi:hypothetical protein
VLQVRLLGGTSAIDARFRPVSAKLPRWISALVLLIAAAAITVGLILAAFGLFAALRIAYGYENSVERASTSAPFGSNGWQRNPSGSADRTALLPPTPPVLASSEPAEAELGVEPPSARSAPSAPNAEPNGIAQDSTRASPVEPVSSAATEVAAATSGEAVTGAVIDREPTRSIDKVAALPPANESAVAPPHQVKRHPIVKRPAARKRVRRVARRSTYPGMTAGPFQPMFGSSTFNSP